MPSHMIDSTFFKDLFGTPAMRAVFDDANLLQKWLDFEAGLARAEAAEGLIPPGAAEEITRKSRAEAMDTKAIKQGIDRTAHPLVSVIWQLSSICGGDAGHYVHWGATTQDVMDTALVLQVKEALGLFEGEINALIAELEGLARTYRDTPMAGRTHGQQALPITFGYKAAVWLAEIRRHSVRLAQSKERVLVVEFGGAVGTLAGVGEKSLAVRARLAQELGLADAEIAWHTARDNFTELAGVLAMIAASLGKIAHEIIELQKTEIGEVEEPFEMGKVGSSTMPQKRNPMICETIVTLARLARQQAAVGLDAMIHEHERDWSSFQMEWVYLPELCILTHAALEQTRRVVAGLVVYPDKMLENLNATGGLLLAERVMLALGKSIGRQAAHDAVYAAAMQAFENRLPFGDVLKQDGEVATYLDPATIDRLLDPLEYTGLASVCVDRLIGFRQSGL
jgi:3-carboxy-cis,cis-muconate cycloisomerase